MAQGQRVGQVDVRVAGLAQGGIVVVTEHLGGVALAQGAQAEPRDVAHHVGAALAERRLALLAVDLGVRGLASLALHSCCWGLRDCEGEGCVHREGLGATRRCRRRCRKQR